MEDSSPYYFTYDIDLSKKKTAYSIVKNDKENKKISIYWKMPFHVRYHLKLPTKSFYTHFVI